MKTNTLFPLSFFLALSISVFFIRSIIELAQKKQLYDGNNHLKLHAERVCSLGGVAIFSSFWIVVFLLSGRGVSAQICILLAGSFILFMAGVKDDLVGLHAYKRLIIQVGVATLLFFVGGVQVVKLPGTDMVLPIWGSYFITIIFIGAVVNAWNFIDGINGLSSGLAIIAATSFAFLFFKAGAIQEMQLAVVLAGGVLGFWFFNFGTAKIFMGDNGSTFIGMLLAYLCIVYLQPPVQAAFVSKLSPVVLLAILIVPLADMVKVVLGRLIKRTSPFKGDRTHIHHIFTDAGLSIKTTNVILYIWTVLVVLIAFNLLPENFLLAAFFLIVLSSVPYFGLRYIKKDLKSKELTQFDPSKAREFS